MAMEPKRVLHDHVDQRMVTANGDDLHGNRNALVQLDPDHPGFRDAEYRTRRNQIAQIALSYRPGEVIPSAPYTSEEDQVWKQIWEALGPAHRKHACAEYLECVRRLEFDTERIPQLGEISK